MRVKHLSFNQNHGLQTVQYHFGILLAQQTEVWRHLSVHIILAWKQYFNVHASLIVPYVTQHNPKHFEKICQTIELQLHFMFSPLICLENVQINYRSDFPVWSCFRICYFWRITSHSKKLFARSSSSFRWNLFGVKLSQP